MNEKRACQMSFSTCSSVSHRRADRDCGFPEATPSRNVHERSRDGTTRHGGRAGEIEAVRGFDALLPAGVFPLAGDPAGNLLEIEIDLVLLRRKKSGFIASASSRDKGRGWRSPGPVTRMLLINDHIRNSSNRGCETGHRLFVGSKVHRPTDPFCDLRSRWKKIARCRARRHLSGSCCRSQMALNSVR